MQSDRLRRAELVHGSHTALTELYGIANLDNLPMSELVDGGASEEQFADPGGRRPAAFTAQR